MLQEYLKGIEDKRQEGKGKHKPAHMVSAWASEQQMAPGQLAAEEKSNEITWKAVLTVLTARTRCVILDKMFEGRARTMQWKNSLILQFRGCDMAIHGISAPFFR